MVKDRCKNCPYARFGSFGKYGQEHYCDVDDHDITQEMMTGHTYICPLDEEERYERILRED